MGGRGSRGRALPQAGRENGTIPAAPAEQSPTEQVDRPPADRIRSAFTELLAEAVEAGTAGSGDGFVSLVDLRERLSDLPRAEVDAALRQLMDDHSNNVWLEPEVHGHRVGPAEREAAIRLGGEDRHKIHIAPPSP
jgi:hypothetical protein